MYAIQRCYVEMHATRIGVIRLVHCSTVLCSLIYNQRRRHSTTHCDLYAMMAKAYIFVCFECLLGFCVCCCHAAMCNTFITRRMSQYVYICEKYMQGGPWVLRVYNVVWNYCTKLYWLQNGDTSFYHCIFFWISFIFELLMLLSLTTHKSAQALPLISNLPIFLLYIKQHIFYSNET